MTLPPVQNDKALQHPKDLNLESKPVASNRCIVWFPSLDQACTSIRIESLARYRGGGGRSRTADGTCEGGGVTLCFFHNVSLISFRGRKGPLHAADCEQTVITRTKSAGNECTLLTDIIQLQLHR